MALDGAYKRLSRTCFYGRRQFERAEAEDRITVRALRRVAESMCLELVRGLPARPVVTKSGMAVYSQGTNVPAVSTPKRTKDVQEKPPKRLPERRVGKFWFLNRPSNWLPFSRASAMTFTLPIASPTRHPRFPGVATRGSFASKPCGSTPSYCSQEISFCVLTLGS